MQKSELFNSTNSFIEHVSSNYNQNKPLIFWVDLFSGAGGTSTGIHLANQSNVYVAACVNHDANAIKSHAQNHPNTLHFTEDIRDFSVVEQLNYLVAQLRSTFRDCKIKIWASLECTNFSKAKGGMPRDADSRTLAEHMFIYMQLQPDVFWFENVREFMAWGPLDQNGKPVSKCNGRDYLRWVDQLKAYGYNFDWKLLNAADFGAYQSRERLFLQFPKKGYPFAWPEQTHSKKGSNESLFDLPKWKPVRDVLDLNDEGTSIFERKKPLSENTEKRILAGLQKFVAKGDNAFMKKYFSGRPMGKVTSINEPSGTITTAGTQAFVKVDPFTMKYNSGNDQQQVKSLNEPVNTITSGNSHTIVIPKQFLTSYYGNGGTHDVENPSPTVTCKDRISKIEVKFLDMQYGNSTPTSVDHVAGSVTTTPKHKLVTVDSWIMNTNYGNIRRSIEDPSSTLTASRRHPYLANANSSTSPPLPIDQPSLSITQPTHIIVNPGWGGHPTSADGPCCTVIARQDKAPLYLLAIEHGFVSWAVYATDSPTMVKIKEFMVLHGITDIKMRMLKIPELLQIQGFPKDYKLIGTQTEQKKYIGNAVEVNMARALAFADYELEVKIAA